MQYGAIGKLSVVVAGVIFLSYFLRPESAEPTNVEKMGGITLGMLAAVTFFIGVACSGFCGYITMVVSAQANVRERVLRAARMGRPLFSVSVAVHSALFWSLRCASVGFLCYTL